MEINEVQRIKDENYAMNLGYSVDFVKDDNLIDIEYQTTHLFDYEKKTKEYLESLYY